MLELLKKIGVYGGLLNLGLISGQSAAAPQFDGPPAVWTSEHGDVLLNGQVFHIKGANWFGFDTGQAKLLGLDRRSMASILDWLKAEKFNALRIPLSVAWSLDFNHVPYDQNFRDEDGDLRGKPWIQILEKLIYETEKRGMVLMLDMHTIAPGDNLTTKRWYSDRYSICDFRWAWHNILNRVGDRWNIMGLDLKNELHDVDWGSGVFTGEYPISCVNSWGQYQAAPWGYKPTDFKIEVESLVPELARERTNSYGRSYTFNGLYIVQGMHHGKVGQMGFPYQLGRGFGYWYGGNLEGLKYYPLNLPTYLNNRIAYTIHVYGPAVYPQPYFDELAAYQYPHNMDQVYEVQNGFIEALTGRAVIIGEWGGINQMLDYTNGADKAGKNDGAIVGAIAQWFPKHCISDAFWWALNPESTDTGGLLNADYYTPVGHRVGRTWEMMPNPSELVMGGDGKVYFSNPGDFHPECYRR